MTTPFLPGFRACLAPLGSRTAQAAIRVRSHTLCQLEDRFGAWLPESLFPKASCKANSRDRSYTAQRTFWCALWQSLNPHASGREVVRQLQAAFRLEGGPGLSAEDGAYCRARERLPIQEFPKALAGSAKSARRLAGSSTILQGRSLKAVDGTALTLLADTAKNRAAYPAIQCRPGQPSFPMMRVVVLFCLVSGAILAAAQGSLIVSEWALLNQLAGCLAKGDILLGDRGFGGFPLLALLKQNLGVDFIGRTTRRIDGRQRKQRLGHNDWLVVWKKGCVASPWMTAAQWQALPDTLEIRVVKGSLTRKGFRVRQAVVFTTLLDAHAYPPQEILKAYLRRWALELCLDDLKTTLGMESLRSRSPGMAQKELYQCLIAHNLVRCTMASAATQHNAGLERISFKGCLDGLRQYAHAMARAKTKKLRRQLWAELLATLAADQVPARPGRREPRAVKRKKNRYARLKGPRHQFRDHLKRHDRRRISRLRKLGLM